MVDDTRAPGSDEERAQQQREEEELRRVLREKGLVQRTAFIKDPDAGHKKSKGAERVKKFRERQREKGLTPAVVPATVAAAVAKAGGWTEWEAVIRASATTAPLQPAPAPGPAVEPQREPGLSAQDRADLDVGRRVRDLAGWRGRAVRWLLGST